MLATPGISLLPVVVWLALLYPFALGRNEYHPGRLDVSPGDK